MKQYINNKKIVDDVDNNLLYNYSRLIKHVDVELDLRSTFGFFFTITTDNFSKILSADVLSKLPTHIIRLFLGFCQLYENVILFRVEARDDDVETLLGFEQGDNTFTVVLDVHGNVKGIKFYCNAYDNRLHYKIKFNDSEEVYKNYKTDIWFSVCQNSVYTEILNYHSAGQLVRMINRTKQIASHINSFHPSCDERALVLSTRDAYLSLCANTYSHLILFLLRHPTINVTPEMHGCLEQLSNLITQEELNEHSVNHND